MTYPYQFSVRFLFIILFLSFLEAQDEEDKLDDETISARLREDVLEASGRLRKKVAESYLEPEATDLQVMRSKKQRLSVTCIAVSSDEKCVFAGSKDCSLVKCKCKIVDSLFSPVAQNMQ